MAAREENILNVPISETLEGMHVLCDTGDTGEPYRVAASLFIAEATQAAKDAVSNLDPKDVILKGFTALTAGKPAITANTTLLAAIQSLYAMVGSGKVKIVSDGADQTGMVSWNGTSASGFVINVNEAAIYTRSQWTQSNPDSVTDANWIAAVKTGGTKTPFAAAAQNPNMGDLPISSNVKFEDSKVGIGSMLRMLTAAANVGRMRIVSGNPLTGASGKPELAFIVNIIQGVNAETDDTFGLQIFHLTNDYIHVIPSPSADITWTALQSMTDEAVIRRLNSTNGWRDLGVKLPWTGGSVIHGKDITKGLGYLIPENIGDFVAFRSTMDSSQVPAGQEGFGFLAKVNSSESMAMMMQNDPAGGGKMKFFMGRVQNDGSGTEWQELTTGSSSGIEQLFVGDIGLADAAPETFYLGGEVHDGDLLMIVYDFISGYHTMVGPKAGRSIIWTATSGTYDITVEAFDYSNDTEGVSRISGFNLMLSASGTILSMEATGEVYTIIEAFHVVGIYRLSKAL